MQRFLNHINSWLLLFGLLVAGTLSAQQSETFVIDDDFKEISLGRYVQYLSDRTNNMDLIDFLEVTSESETALKANDKDEVKLGYGQNQYWTKFSLHNESSEIKELFLNIAYPNLDDVTIYQRVFSPLGDSIMQIAQMGDRYAFGNKLLSHRNYVIPIQLLPEQQTEFIFQIKKQWESVNFPLILTDEYNLVRRTNNDNLFIGTFAGMYIMFMLTLVAVFLFTRNKFFILYLALNVLTLLDFLSDTGIGLQYIWPTIPIVQNILPYIVILGSILIHITFIRLFFQTAIHLARFNRFLLFLFWMVVSTVIALACFVMLFPQSNLPFQIGYNIVNGIYLAYGLLVLVLSIVTLIQVRRKEIFWIVIVISIQIAKWSLQIIARGNAFPIIFKNFSIYDLNLFHSHISTPHIILMMILLEVFVVSTILAVSFYRFIQDNSSGKYKLMMMNRNTINAYIVGQENERLSLTEKINEGIGEDIRMLEMQMAQAVKKIEDPIARAKITNIKEEVSKVGESVKRITTDFVPAELVNKNFYDTLKTIFGILKEKGVEVKYQLASPSPPMNSFSQMNISRILQEIVSNIIKHAQARSVLVKSYYYNDLVIVVQDDGVGFETDGRQGGIGLINIQSRVNGMNGTLELTSSKEKGTTIIIKIPKQNIA